MLSYIESGTGVPLVWIHGFPLSGRIFERQLQIGGVRHIVPDLPGFGRTALSAGLTVDTMAEDVLKLLDRLAIPRAVFAGLSMGGYVLFAAARLAPERMAGVILIDTRETADSADARRDRHEMIDKVNVEGTAEVISSMLPKMLTAGGMSHQEFVREVMESASPEGVSAALRAMAERPDSTAVLQSLTAPCLIVVGEQDPITPPTDAERMQSLARDGRMVIVPEAAHLSNVEQPDVFNRHVEEFLRNVVAGSLQV
jgi:3-oxoadipate enol-lactonase